MGLIRHHLVAFLWGLAEATFFFVVPDVFLSYVGVRFNFKTAVKSALFALFGAVIGGFVLYSFGKSQAADLLLLIERLQAISPAMIEAVKTDLAQSGLISLFIGSFSGVPYKVFAATAGQLSIPLVSFMAVSIPARLIRWFIVIVIAQFFGKFLLKRFSRKQVLWLLCSFWGLFYGLFFTLMPN